MNDSKMISRRATGFPLLALLFASGIGVMLAGLRIARTNDWHYMLLPGNLFLAWLPLVFALGVYHLHHRGERRTVRLGVLAGLWLLFFPNAPYIFTDLVHMFTWFRVNFWMDLSLVLLVALTGFLVGFLSLYLMQLVVVERFGRVAGWIFILAVAWLTGFGVYLGRFLRWNSWDVVMHPLGLTHAIGHVAIHPLADPTSVIFPTLFATFLFLGYLMLYALTHMHPGELKIKN
ncbi:MAG: rane protein [Pedosphaera sp.]|nr:rane protein [Pedosphaera sp.]